MSIYNLKSLDATRFMIAKFDEDFNVLSTYTLAPAERGTGYSCDCPANQRSVITKLCRHRRMLPIMMGAVNTDRFYNPETGVWCEPLGDLHREPSDEPEAQPEPEVDPATLLAAVEPPEGLVGEALGSSAASPIPTTFEQDVLTGRASRMDEEADAACAPNRVEPQAPAPTIRRR